MTVEQMIAELKKLEPKARVVLRFKSLLADNDSWEPVRHLQHYPYKSVDGSVGAGHVEIL